MFGYVCGWRVWFGHEGEGQKTPFKSLFSLTSVMRVPGHQAWYRYLYQPSHLTDPITCLRACVHASVYVCLLSLCGLVPRVEFRWSDLLATIYINWATSQAPDLTFENNYSSVLTNDHLHGGFLYYFLTASTFFHCHKHMLSKASFISALFLWQELNHYTVLRPLCFVWLVTEKKMKNQIVTKKSVWPLKTDDSTKGWVTNAIAGTLLIKW